MSNLPKSMELDRSGIERLPVKEEVKVWLRRLLDTLEVKYQLIRDFAEAGGFATKNWRGREDSNKDLKIQKKVSGVWTDETTHEFSP